jgi:hypothetical protein
LGVMKRTEALFLSRSVNLKSVTCPSF